MVSTKQNICYFISSKDIGATYHLCQLATVLNQSEHFSYCFLSDSKEQTPGSLQKLKDSGACLKLFEGLEQKGKRLSAAWRCIKTIYQRRPRL